VLAADVIHANRKDLQCIFRVGALVLLINKHRLTHSAKCSLQEVNLDGGKKLFMSTAYRSHLTEKKKSSVAQPLLDKS